MSVHVLFIAPYRGLKELGTQLASEQTDLDIVVKEADLTEAIALVSQAATTERIDFIISRGGTARLLKQYTSIPVVEIQVSGYDIIRSLTLIKPYNRKVQVIGFPNVCEGVVSIADLLNMDIAYTIVHNESDVKEAVKNATANGSQIILGDTVTTRVAQESGVQGMLITSGREAVVSAFDQVRDMARMVKNQQQRDSVYQSYLLQEQDAIVIFEDDGEVYYCNSAFANINGKSIDDITRQLFIESPWKDIYDAMFTYQTKQAFPKWITIKNKTYPLQSGKFHSQGKMYMYVKLNAHSSDRSIESGVRLYRNPLFPVSFAQIVANSKATEKLIAKANKLLLETAPITIIGEEGTGKQFFANAIHTEGLNREKDFLQLHIKDKITTDLTPLLESLEEDRNGTIYIRGFENLDTANRERILQLKKIAMGTRFIFSFTSEDQIEELPDAHKTFLIEGSILHMPRLQERSEDLDELIRIFIGNYNSSYGKQVVGIKPAALELLHNYSFPENIEQLKKIVKKLVKHATDNYLSEDVVAEVLNEQNTPEHSAPIDLSKTLEDITTDIVHLVMKEENMNQSKAAQRLGINRTTLWRKLNKDIK
ncbi:PrpR N-terminal domain-containing protein [Paenalkalicoccus suaedae]|uniref:PrpR N-terminal domain-containing protein n=1 Tax=Paenalkalicoccus suaedae TaxID=2592382 RepID=A0A859FIF9_9BACI|nr:sigma-54-dependent Fis family transcriptional regulator [Paenalkalicoccus suaedae]QKS72630.1 PrpR N-terminal domain-containing protein [Paenalkalicoccus suaedae]